MTLEETLKHLEDLQGKVLKYAHQKAMTFEYRLDYRRVLELLREYKARDELRSAMKWYKNHLLR